MWFFSAWLRCRKSPEGREFNARLRHPATGKLFCQPSSEWVPYFESGKDKAAKGEGWAPLSFAVPMIQWDSNSHCPYGKKAMGKLFEMNSHSYTCCMTCVVLCKYPQKHVEGHKYSRTSMARTLMARLPWLFRTHS